MHPCPGCSGDGVTPGIGCGSGGCRVLAIPCLVCNKTGEVDDAGLEQFEQGRALRKKRVELDLSLREVAKALGMSPVELGEVERGIRGGAAEIAAKLEGMKP